MSRVTSEEEGNKRFVTNHICRSMTMWQWWGVWGGEDAGRFVTSQENLCQDSANEFKHQKAHLEIHHKNLGKSITNVFLTKSNWKMLYVAEVLLRALIKRLQNLDFGSVISLQFPLRKVFHRDPTAHRKLTLTKREQQHSLAKNNYDSVTMVEVGSQAFCDNGGEGVTRNLLSCVT